MHFSENQSASLERTAQQTFFLRLISHSSEGHGHVVDSHEGIGMLRPKNPLLPFENGLVKFSRFLKVSQPAQQFGHVALHVEGLGIFAP